MTEREERRLLDERAIERLLTRYCRLVDDGRTTEIAALFEPDASLDLMGRTFAGRDAIEAVFAEAGGPVDRPTTTHMLSNIDIELGRNTAASVSDLVVVSRQSDGSFDVTLAGRYHDDLRRDPDQPERWRFSARRVIVHAKSTSAP